MQRNAAFLDAAFQKRGFKTDAVAEQRPARDLRRTAERETRRGRPFCSTCTWTVSRSFCVGIGNQQGPFEPALKRKTADGGWQTLPLDRLFGAGVDPEWRLFRASAGDDKGPIVMFLAAVDAMRAIGREPAINVKVILDPEEESGGARGFRSFIAERQALLASDGLVVFDGPQGEDNRPASSASAFARRDGAADRLRTQERGAQRQLRETTRPIRADAGPARRQHERRGRPGDDPGFYDAVTIDADTSRLLAAAPDEEAALNERLGIAAREKVGRNLREALMYPTLTLTRMVRGSSTGTAKWCRSWVQVISGRRGGDHRDSHGARDPARRNLRDVFHKYVASQGYQVVAGQPTDEERRRFRFLAALSVSGNPGVRSGGPRNPLGAWLRRASRNAFGRKRTSRRCSAPACDRRRDPGAESAVRHRAAGQRRRQSARGEREPAPRQLPRRREEHPLRLSGAGGVTAGVRVFPTSRASRDARPARAWRTRRPASASCR
jgi:hypothetical protein